MGFFKAIDRAVGSRNVLSDSGIVRDGELNGIRAGRGGGP